jgi:hypothetical protein
VDLAAVITRIRAQCASFSNRVAGASELPAAQRDSDTIAKPSAWVVPAREIATQNMIELGSLDRIQESFYVIVALDNTGEPRGQTSSIAVEAIRDELRAGLIGWAVDSDHLPTQYDAGDLGDIDRSTLWYQFSFFSVRTGGSMVEWGVKATLYLASTSSATALTSLASAIATTLSGTRLTRDIATGRQVIAQNTTRFRMIFGAAPWVIDSNDTGEVLKIELTVIRHLGSSEAERDYTEGNMLTEQLAILAPSYWQVASDIEVHPNELPELSLPVDPAA